MEPRTKKAVKRATAKTVTRVRDFPRWEAATGQVHTFEDVILATCAGWNVHQDELLHAAQISGTLVNLIDNVGRQLFNEKHPLGTTIAKALGEVRRKRCKIGKRLYPEQVVITKQR